MAKLGVFTGRDAGEAQFILGEKYAAGDGVPKDVNQAANFYRRAAESGNAKAQYELGVLCQSGEAFPRDFDAAVAWFRKSADQGYAPAQEELGGLYAGRLVSTNLNESETWITKAIESYKATAQKGDLDAHLRIAFLYRYWKGTNYLHESETWYAAALDSFKKPAEQGVVTAQVQLGLLYSEGGTGRSRRNCVVSEGSILHRSSTETQGWAILSHQPWIHPWPGLRDRKVSACRGVCARKWGAKIRGRGS
jgi:TPR repeat protein